MHKTMAAPPFSQHPSVWDQALDWLLLSQAKPKDQAIARQLANWLAEDPRHQQAYDKAARVWHLTGNAPAATLNAAQFPTPTLLERKAQPPQRRARWRWITATAALAACLTVLFSPQAERLLWADYHSATNQRQVVTLADGSQVILGAESALNVHQTALERRATLLQGQAFFEVTHDSRRPFIVQAGQTEITVTGTAFAVKRAEAGIAVEVEQGSVEVARDPINTVTLTPGQRVEVAADSGIMTLSSLPTSHVAAWRKGRLVVDGASLAEIVAAFRPHYQGVIVLQAPQLAERKITGVFDLTHPQAALRNLVALQGGVMDEISPYLIHITDP